MTTLDMKMAHVTLRHTKPINGEALSFYVRPGNNGNQYAGTFFFKDQKGRPAKTNALYKINVRFK